MSRQHARARQRADRKENLRSQVAAARGAGPEALSSLLSHVAASDRLVSDLAWWMAEDKPPLDAAEMAAVTQKRAAIMQQRRENIRQEFMAVLPRKSKSPQAPESPVDLEKLWNLLSRIAASGDLVWEVARSVGEERHLDDAVVALLMQAAAPHLADKTPGSVIKRHARAREEFVP